MQLLEFTKTEGLLDLECKIWDNLNILQCEGQYCSVRNCHLQLSICPQWETPCVLLRWQRLGDTLKENPNFFDSSIGKTPKIKLLWLLCHLVSFTLQVINTEWRRTVPNLLRSIIPSWAYDAGSFIRAIKYAKIYVYYYYQINQKVGIINQLFLKCWLSFYFLLLKHWKWKSFRRVQLFASPWTIQSMRFSRILEWVAFPLSRGSSQSIDQTEVSHTAGGFFTSWATREAHWITDKILKMGVWERMDTCICMAEFRCCSPETHNTVNRYTLVQNEKLKVWKKKETVKD